jgi:hypothetical protein
LAALAKVESKESIAGAKQMTKLLSPLAVLTCSQLSRSVKPQINLQRQIGKTLVELSNGHQKV